MVSGQLLSESFMFHLPRRLSWIAQCNCRLEMVCTFELGPAVAVLASSGALACIMARSAAYTGRLVTWEERFKSTEVWDPKIDLNKLH